MGLLNSPTAETYQAWARGMHDLDERQVKMGLYRARDFTGYFNLPAFRELCKTEPEVDGVPPLEQAYEEACLAPSPKAEQAWSHPVVFHAGRMTGWSDLHALVRDEGLKRFRYHYEILKRRAASGEDLTIESPDALPDRVTRVLPTEEALSEVAKLREALA